MALTLTAMAFKSEAIRKAYFQKWYKHNRTRLLKERVGYYQRNKEKIKAYSKRWDRANRHRKAAKAYSISHDCAKELLAIKKCAICGKAAEHIDHNHKTNKVRGRLCNNCNNGIGRFRDNPKLLRKAANYLERKRKLCALA